MAGGAVVLAITVVATLPAEAQVQLPAPVPVPQVELPPAPVPVPAPPPVQVPAPPPVQVPAPSLPPVSVPVPAPPPVSVPSLPSTGSQPRSVGSVVEQTGSAAVSTLERGSSGKGEGARKPARGGRRGIHGTPYRKRGRLVRAYRGCLDRLPPMQRSALVLRYGIGRVEARSARRAAREMRVSRRRFGLIERRGVRSLVKASRRSSCERTGVSRGTLVAVYRLVLDEPPGSGFTFASSGTATLVEASVPGGDVAGVRESGGNGDAGDQGAAGGGNGSSEAGPSLPTPFGDVTAGPDSPLFILFLVLALAATAIAARVIVRALR